MSNKKSKKRRRKLIEQMVEQGVKKYGEGSTMTLSSDKLTSVIKRTISTNSPELDMILAKDINNNFGIPEGRIIGVSGKEASGKTTLIIELMKSTQKMGGVAALIETEHAFDPIYAKKLGLNTNQLLMSQPDYLEEGLDMIETMIKIFKEAKAEHLKEEKTEWDVPMFIGLDSIAGVPPKAEWEAGSYEDEQALGLHARRLSKFFRKISGSISKEQICLVCTNQLKTDTNIKFGNKDTEIGGKALKFHASVRLDLRQSGLIRETKDSDPIGIEVLIKTVKNKLMMPFRSVTVPLLFGIGFDYTHSLFNALLSNGSIKKVKNTFFLKYRIGKNRELLKVAYKKDFIIELRELIESSPRIKNIIEQKLNRGAS